MITGNRDEARQFGRRTIEIAEQCRFDYFQLLGRQYVLIPELDRPCDVTELEQYGVGMDLVGHGAFRPTYLGIVAQNHHFRGDADPALRAGVRTGHRAAARHGFQRRQSEAFVERGKHEQVARVIELEQVGIGYEAEAMRMRSPTPDSRAAACT